jgi:hypothetical protein
LSERENNPAVDFPSPSQDIIHQINQQASKEEVKAAPKKEPEAAESTKKKSSLDPDVVR